MLCLRFCRKKSYTILLLDKAEKYVKEKISIEFILKKLNEIDKLKFCLLNKEELYCFQAIPSPNFNEIFSENNTSTNLSYIDELYRKFEFYIPNKIREKECYTALERKQNKTDTHERLVIMTRMNY